MLDGRAHDFVALFLVGIDHGDGIEVGLGQRLGGCRVGLEPLGIAAHGVHHHRVVDGGGQNLAGAGVGAHRGQVGLIGHGRIVLPGDKGLGRRLGLQRHGLDVLHGHAVLVQHPGQTEVGSRARRADGDGLAFQIGKVLDVVAHGNAICAIGLVHLEDLHDGHAIGVPGHMRLHGGGGTLHGTRGQRQMPVLLGNHLDFDIEAVLLEDPGLVRKRQWREACPSRHAQDDLGLLSRCMLCSRHQNGCG